MTDYQPDYIGALVVRIKEAPALAELGTVGVSAAAPGGDTPGFAVWVARSGGRADQDVGDLLPRVDVHCYGKDLRVAADLWRRVYSWLCPADGRATQFARAHCLVRTITLEAGPLDLVEESGWPKVWASYSLRVAGRPV